MDSGKGAKPVVKHKPRAIVKTPETEESVFLRECHSLKDQHPDWTNERVADEVQRRKARRASGRDASEVTAVGDVVAGIVKAASAARAASRSGQQEDQSCSGKGSGSCTGIGPLGP